MDIAFNGPQRLPEALDDETLNRDRPAYRALLLRRLEELNGAIDDELEGGKDRVRWAELKLRCVKQTADLLQMSRPAAVEPPEETDAGVEQDRVRRMVSASLDDLAGREG